MIISIFSHKESKIVVISLIAILFIVVPTFFIFDYFPGGYSLEESEDQITIIENGILQNEHFTVVTSRENEIKIALLKNSINEFKGIWFMNFFILPALFISTAINYKQKSVNYLVVMLIFWIIIIPLFVYLYTSNLNFIEQLIRGLKM